MLFKSKPHIYLRFYDKSIHYLAMDAQKQNVVDKGDLVFDTGIVFEGRVSNAPLIKTRLDALIKEKKWKGAKVSIILPDDLVTIRHEDIPVQLSKSEVKDYIHLHLNTSIRLPFDNPKIDFEIIGQKDESQQILLVAYPSEEVRIYLDTLQEVGLKPEVADLSALSVYRVVKDSSEINLDDSDHHLLLQWHPIDTSVTVFSNDVPQFNRHTRLSRIADFWDLLDEGEWTWKGTPEQYEDNLDDQLNGLERFLEFYRYSILNGENSVSSIILTGSFPELARLEERLGTQFSIPVYTLNTPMDLSHSEAVLFGLTLKNENGKAKKPQPKPSKKKQGKTEVADK